MDNQKLAYMNTPAPVTNSMVQALDRYITHNLAERGWLSIDEDNQDLSSEILRNLLDLCHGLNSQRFILETLADNGTHFAMAKWISTIFLEGNLGPKDSSLLSFTDGVINFFHDLCQDQFAWSHTAIVGSQGVASGGPSSYTRTLPQTGTFPLFRLPAELRNIVYREALVVPNCGLMRTFTSPALLHANKIIRNEALPIFYGENQFEITVKRSPQDEVRAAAGGLPSVDMWVWRRFLHMWDEFSCFGTNCLRYLRHLTLIYQLSIDDGYSFGEGEFDKRLGFRFSCDPFREDHCGSNLSGDSDGEKSAADDSSGQIFQPDPVELDLEGHEGDDSEGANGVDENDGEVEQVSEDAFDAVGFFELNRGTLALRSRHETHFFLYHKMCEYGTDEMWEVYPMKKLTTMLWRCVRDCPLASKNIDLICEDLPYWMDNIGSHRGLELNNLDDEDD